MRLYTLRLSDGKLLWQNDQLTSVWIAAGSNIVFGAIHQGAVDVALDMQTGATLWQIGGYGYCDDRYFLDDGEPIISNNIVYVVASHLTHTQGDCAPVGGPTMLYAFDAANGHILRTFKEHLNLPVLHATRSALLVLVDGSFNPDTLYALRPTDGAILWQRSNGSSSGFANVTGAPTASVVYVSGLQEMEHGQAQMYLSALDPATGTLYWSTPVGPIGTLKQLILS
jgi:outer membrane protein assembly factor BamB